MARVILKGIPVSAGISIGRAFFMNRRHFHLIPRHAVAEHEVETELTRLDDAFAQSRTLLQEARDKIPAALKDHAAIINSHLMISRDPKLLGSARAKVSEMGITAEWALEKAVAEVEQAFAAIEDPYIRERIQDVRVVAQRIQSLLLGQNRELNVESIKGRVVLMAHDLTPADTIGIEPTKIMSFATAMGGKTSHTGILARSMRIPALVGVTSLEEKINDGDLVVIDGLKGRIFADPDEDELAYFSDLKYQFENYQQTILRSCHLPGETIDGYQIKVLANIELFEEVTSARDSGAEGIGLFRTEYAFITRNDMPGEDELAEEYDDMAAIMAPHQVVFRTLDVGADKVMSSIQPLEEPNPALGLRAIRFCLQNKDIFLRQLRAILRASFRGNVSLMFPMISGLNEIRQAKAILRQAQRQLYREGQPFDENMPVGIMVELPAAVTIAEFLAREVDFFSIGTNDLIQYSLGIDRTNKHVSYLYQPLHPSVVRSIKHVVDAAHEAGIEVSVCGEVASDPYCIPILMGMQIDAISITPQAIPGIKHVIRQTTMEDCKQLMTNVIDTTTVSRINRLVKESIFKRFPEELTFFSSLLDSDDLMAEDV